MDKRTFLKASAAALLGTVVRAQGRGPNIVLICADDLGYGDLGCYGSAIRTPNLDRMAGEGVRFLQCNSASAVCTPARAALLTGRYPTRLGLPTVLFPGDTKGLPDGETTLAQMLKPRGYRNKCVGKWHLGAPSQFLPTNRGFDEFFGMPYSHDMWPRPLMNNCETVEPKANLTTLTDRYAAASRDFITRAKDSPFFLYVATAMPHIPLVSSERFTGRSPLGAYGDAVEETDWLAGQILGSIADNGLDDSTLVLFTSDHGPWYQGATGGLRGRKGETWEGGVRVPLIARCPSYLPRGRVAGGFASTMDILPTIARFTGAPLPGKPLDGVDIWPLFTGQQEEADRDPFLYFDYYNLQCARSGRWKLHMSRYSGMPWLPEPVTGRINLPLPRPELYDAVTDPGESCDVARDNPQIVADIRARVDSLLPTFPDEVKSAWRDTMDNQVQDTPAGAWPAKQTSP